MFLCVSCINLIWNLSKISLKVIFYNLCSCIITNSVGSKNSLKKFVFNKKKIKTIYNPYLKKINHQNFKKQNIIINVGRFRKQKNQILLIRAFYKFSQEYKNYKQVWTDI